MDGNKLLKVLLLLGCAGCFIFMAACCGGDSWIQAFIPVKGVVVDIHSGLWGGCSSDTGCQTFDLVLADWFHAVRAFSIGAVLAMAGAGLLALLHIISNNMRGIIVSIFCFGSAGCQIIALSIYMNKQGNFDNPFINPGWSFILGALGAAGAVVCGIIGILAK